MMRSIVALNNDIKGIEKSVNNLRSEIEVLVADLEGGEE